MSFEGFNHGTTVIWIYTYIYVCVCQEKTRILNLKVCSMDENAQIALNFVTILRNLNAISEDIIEKVFYRGHALAYPQLQVLRHVVDCKSIMSTMILKN